MAFQRFEWGPSLELLQVAKRRDATGRFSKAAKRYFFSRVSEATLGSFPGHFWNVLGTKLGGVSAFRVVSMSRAVAADVKATGRDRTVISKAAKKSFFFLGFQKQR